MYSYKLPCFLWRVEPVWWLGKDNGGLTFSGSLGDHGLWFKFTSILPSSLSYGPSQA